MSQTQPILKLLIVDDEPGIREILAQELRNLGSVSLQVITAENGAEALAILMKESVQAVLSDIAMPEMDGITFLKTARRSGIKIPFIVMTGYHDQYNRQMALDSGATDFIEKPFSMNLLKSVLQHALKLDSSKTAA